MALGLSPVGEVHLGGQFLDLGVGQDDELLVGGRVEPELVAFLLEDALHLHGHVDGVTRELEIERCAVVVDGREECLELQSDKGSLGNDGAVLLLDGEEMLVGLAVGEDNGLAAEGTNLRATDIEHVAMAGEIGQGDVVVVGHETIAQTGPVDIKRYVVTAADLIDVVELAGGVERAEFGGEGDVDESWVYGMVFVAVVHVVVEVFVEHAGLHLAQGVGDGDDLMLRKLHGTGLVDVDVA